MQPSPNLPHLYHEMIPIKGGKFMMGSDHEDAFDDEQPVHAVTVSDFHLGKYPVTQALWKHFMGNNPSHFQGDIRPVEKVSWDDAQEFIAKMNKATGLTYRLSTEAEWEYAARGGQLSRAQLYSGSDLLDEVGWYDDNSHEETKPVGLKLPNELGIYDMSGNVREWCEDDWHSNYEGAPGDGKAWVDSPRARIRVHRGGSWDFLAQYCRVALRGSRWPDSRYRHLGFRLVLVS